MYVDESGKPTFKLRALAWAASALAYWATMRSATDGPLWHKKWFTMLLYVKCMFRKLNLFSPLILAISFAGRTRTLSPSWMCPDSIRPATLNPDPWAEEGRKRARRHLVIWSFHGCNSYYDAHINNMHTTQMKTFEDVGNAAPEWLLNGTNRRNKLVCRHKENIATAKP